jgi:WD40 repeat protein
MQTQILFTFTLIALFGHHELVNASESEAEAVAAIKKLGGTSKQGPEPTLRVVLKDHTGGVPSLAVTPDGKTLVSASYKTVKIWDLATGKERATLKGHTDWVWSVAITRDGKTIASGSNDKTVKLWNITTGKETMTYKGRFQLRSVGFTPDGKTLAAGTNNLNTTLWDVASGKERTTLRGRSIGVSSPVFAPDGKMLVLVRDPDRIILWDMATDQERDFVNVGEGFISMAITRDGKTVAAGAGSERGTVKLWDIATGKERANLPGHTARVWSVAFSPDGKMLASASWDGTLRLRDVATGKLRATLKANVGRFYCVAFTPDGKTLIAGGGEGGPSEPGQIMLWDLGGGK